MWSRGNRYFFEPCPNPAFVNYLTKDRKKTHLDKKKPERQKQEDKMKGPTWEVREIGIILD